MKESSSPPNDWIDPKEYWRAKDLSKVPIYKSKFGFDYWVDVVESGVSTSDPNIYFRHRRLEGRDIQFSYGELVIGSKSLIVTNDQCLNPRSNPCFSYCRDSQNRIEWKIERLFDSFTVPDVRNFPWLRQSAPPIDVSGIRSFSSEDEQNLFIATLKELLGKYDMDSFKAIKGATANSVVSFDQNLMKKLAKGDLIDGTRDQQSNF